MATVVACGSIHQGDNRFDALSRGRQCTFVSIAGLIVHHTEKPIHSWNSDTIDHIVKKGDFMLRDALENGRIPDKQTFSIDELGAAVGWFSIERIAKPLSAMGTMESARVSQHETCYQRSLKACEKSYRAYQKAYVCNQLSSVTGACESTRESANEKFYILLF